MKLRWTIKNEDGTTISDERGITNDTREFAPKTEAYEMASRMAANHQEGVVQLIEEGTEVPIFTLHVRRMVEYTVEVG